MFSPRPPLAVYVLCSYLHCAAAAAADCASVSFQLSDCTPFMQRALLWAAARSTFWSAVQDIVPLRGGGCLAFRYMKGRKHPQATAVTHTTACGTCSESGAPHSPRLEPALSTVVASGTRPARYGWLWRGRSLEPARVAPELTVLRRARPAVLRERPPRSALVTRGHVRRAPVLCARQQQFTGRAGASAAGVQARAGWNGPPRSRR